MIEINVNAMTNQEIVQQCKSLEKQMEVITKGGYATICDEFTNTLAILKQAMIERGL